MKNSGIFPSWLRHKNPPGAKTELPGRQVPGNLSGKIRTADLKGSYGKIEPGIHGGRLRKPDLDRAGRMVGVEQIRRSAELHLYPVPACRQFDRRALPRKLPGMV